MISYKGEKNRIICTAISKTSQKRDHEVWGGKFFRAAHTHKKGWEFSASERWRETDTFAPALVESQVVGLAYQRRNSCLHPILVESKH